ncbi:methyl-CpG-binding domain-containing protein 7-like [Hibiscus syriacus]|uniref:Methyl-CpG-binding domain-containing protein 7-like n=1 Tax=Hibiscus syriacus TaxID=106335 RepID=A0A6A3CW15_HIBSY|nr:methyl-CpG-binding domain-containing protein 7-like [Hibiscus syriacus]
MGPARGLKKRRKIEKKTEENASASSEKERSIDWWDELSRKMNGVQSQTKGLDKFKSVFKISRKTFNYICSLEKEDMMVKPGSFTFSDGHGRKGPSPPAVAFHRNSDDRNKTASNGSTTRRITAWSCRLLWPVMRFRDIVTGWPGKIEDWLSSTTLSNYTLGGERTSRITSRLRAEFNKRHSASQLVAHRALARLKEMWKIEGVMRRPDKHKLPRIILVCCLLHNIIINLKDDVQDEMRLSHDHDSGYR